MYHLAIMGAGLICVLLHLLAPEPAESHAEPLPADAVFLPAEVAHAPEQELMPTETANVAEFLGVDDSLDSTVGTDVFMSADASAATWQPSRSAAEFLGRRSEVVWMVLTSAVGPEAFISSRDAETPRPEVFLPTQSGSSDGPEPTVFMIEPAPADPQPAVFMPTAR
jgi:hypothetical protein